MAQAASQENGSSWIRDSREVQQRYYEQLSDIDQYEPNTSGGLWILRRKVGYAIYGIPDEESKCENGHTGYNVIRYKTIKSVADVIRDVNKKKKNEKDKLDMAIVFVVVQCEEEMRRYPVFRILLANTMWEFVDTDCRIYSSWEDFLTSNQLPEGKICWPCNGIYSADTEGNVKLGRGITPAATPDKKMAEATDKRNGKVSLGATAVCLVGMVTPLGPWMTVASACAFVTSAYTAVRSGTTLNDRARHGQTVNPFKDREVALSWVSVVGSVCGVAGGAMSTKVATLAKNGEVMGKAGRITCNALNVASLAVNGTGIGIGAYSIRERIKAGEVTSLEVLQFSASVLFFAHATVNFQTASQIIKENQKGVLDNFEKSLRSNRHKKQFKKLAKNTASTADNVMDGNAKVIRSIHNIDNKDDFFAGMVRTRKDFGGHKAIFSENGNIVVNGGAEIHPMKLYELGKQQRREFLSLAKQASQGTISDATFKARFDSVFTTHTAGTAARNTSQNRDATEALNILTSQLQQGIQGITIGTTEIQLIWSVVNELTVLVCSKTDSKLAKWWELIWHHVNKLVREMYATYNEALYLEKQLTNFIDQQNFNLINAIQLTNIFRQVVINVYNQYKDHIVELINDIKKLMKSYKICPLCEQAML